MGRADRAQRYADRAEELRIRAEIATGDAMAAIDGGSPLRASQSAQDAARCNRRSQRLRAKAYGIAGGEVMPNPPDTARSTRNWEAILAVAGMVLKIALIVVLFPFFVVWKVSEYYKK